ncbi:N-6 DNA methylase [candidate division WOR-3 bacterium]|nr:N-6 DNA methylase [candidate division WOR-3 bacterium]
MDKKIEAKKHIKELVERFEENISQYKKTDYDEANTRTDFIDPFFENLGWDVANKQGYAEQYREVVREAKIIIAGKHKAPDYSFRIGGIRKFFVEAKKPSIDLKHEISPAYQLKRYAYTARLPLSILTDFEEFSVYDTRIKPTPKDSASCARIFYCKYKDYLKNFDFIYDTFSKDGILKGSFDRYVESSKNKKGTSEVDKEFLKLIDKWREKLAKNIALRNKSLSLYELNFAVQKIIDRIIFLRIAEDRQIEDYRKLQNLLNGVNTYKRLMEIFLHSDKKYNSGLFDFKKDEITPSLSVDDKIIKEILKSVYYPESPYEFSVLDVEILGNIYEQFLGKTIRLTRAHQVKIEEKPEVKKAGGVYYTPKYIVDYIVKNTFGEIIKGKTPKQIDKIKMLDPACGSGSFLLGAYQELLNYHLDWYSKDTNCKRALKKGQIIQTGKDSFQLTIAEKQRILLNNIFGVDIDTQAVEVSKLSLLLKLLEGETEESTRQLFRYTQMKLLPDLSNNIKCGNSLIGPDYYKQMSLLNDDEARRINVFDWKSAFPDIFKNGGFDCVIGNPPYVSATTLSNEDKVYYKNTFKTAKGRLDTYGLFTEKSIDLLENNGFVSLIVPNKFLTNLHFESLRRHILDECNVLALISPQRTVFDAAAVNNVIFVLRKRDKIKKQNLVSILEINLGIESEICTVKQAVYENDKNHTFVLFSSVHSKAIERKIRKNSIELQYICHVKDGIIAGRIKELLFVDRKKNEYCKPLIFGDDMGRYLLSWKRRYVDYRPEFMKKEERKRVGKSKGLGIRLRVPEIFEVPKILTRKTADRIIATYDSKGCYFEQTVHGTMPKRNFPNIKYILGIMNSKLYEYYYKNIIHQSGTIFPQVRIGYLKTLPIRNVDTENSTDKKLHDDIAILVERMLELQKKFHPARLESDKKMYKTQIDVLDNQIDSLVYELYGLTEKEIKVVNEHA